MVRRIVLRSADPTRSVSGSVGAMLGVLLSVLYLLNLSCGFLEIPDNLPLVGNLDEVAVSAFLFGCLRYLGVDLVPFRGMKRGQAESGRSE